MFCLRLTSSAQTNGYKGEGKVNGSIFLIYMALVQLLQVNSLERDPQAIERFGKCDPLKCTRTHRERERVHSCTNILKQNDQIMLMQRACWTKAGGTQCFHILKSKKDWPIAEASLGNRLEVGGDWQKVFPFTTF